MKPAAPARKLGPVKILVHAEDKVGKSSFAAGAPKVTFLDLEGGTNELKVSRFPRPNNFGETMEVLAYLIEADHDRETLVVDTIDWLEPLIWQEVCARGGEHGSYESIESPGYGKGYVAAAELLRQFLDGLDELVARKGMNIILLAHTVLRKYDPPEAGEGWDRFQVALHKTASPIVREWVDGIFFAKVDERGVKGRKKWSKVKGGGSGRRVLCMAKNPAYQAGSRYSWLPNEVPLDWHEFWRAYQSGKPTETRPPQADHDLLVQVEEGLEMLGADDAKVAEQYIARAEGDATLMKKVLAWIGRKLDEAEPDEAEPDDAQATDEEPGPDGKEGDPPVAEEKSDPDPTEGETPSTEPTTSSAPAASSKTAASKARAPATTNERRRRAAVAPASKD